MILNKFFNPLTKGVKNEKAAIAWEPNLPLEIEEFLEGPKDGEVLVNCNDSLTPMFSQSRGPRGVVSLCFGSMNKEVCLLRNLGMTPEVVLTLSLAKPIFAKLFEKHKALV